MSRMLRLPMLMALLTGCAVGPDYKPPTVEAPPQFMGADSIDALSANTAWWQGFNDPILVSLLQRAVRGNTDLEQARARILQSRAAARAAGAALLPTLNGSQSVDRLDQSLDTPIGAVSSQLGLPRQYTEYSLGATASWEIDLFGGLRRGREAARADADARQADAGAIALSVEAETADTYLNLRALQERLRVAQDQQKNEALLVDLVGQRVDQGVSPDRDLNRAKGALAAVQASEAPLRAAIEAQLNRLDVLLGEQPGTNRAVLKEPRPIPDAPAPAGSAAPQDLLRRRPDVQAAERRLAATHARIGQALAEYYPHVSLSGLIGVASLQSGTLFSSGNAFEWGGAEGLRWRLFDFGRIDAEVAVARAREAESLAAWRGSVLHAAEDVESALVRLTEAARERTLLDEEVASLTKARDQSRQAYQGGVIALITVTDADRELLSASDRLAQVRGDEARQAVLAFRALGGGWQPQQAVDAARVASAGLNQESR